MLLIRDIEFDLTRRVLTRLVGQSHARSTAEKDNWKKSRMRASKCVNFVESRISIPVGL